ncbi:retrovirus-related pol polyprotein from transposon TNT 1-94, partial [Tanacetum coccineum]
EALREKYDLKLKLEKFETSSKNVTNLLNSQISVNNKTGIGFDSQITENELHDIHKNNSEVFESASDSSVNEIEEENNQVNDRFKKVEGYYAVLPPYTRNYMPSRLDLSFAGLDDYVYKTNVSETITSVPRNESTASKSSKDNLEQPKDVRPSAPIVEEWESDSDDDCVTRPSIEQNKPSGLTCLFAKATIDESNLWHRRLGHVNFKTMNKLMRENLVRGLPSKLFENDHTCVACQKRKQHKASYSLLPTTFLAKAINTACYVQNRVLITKPHNKTPYELLIGRSPNLDFMRHFGCPVTILNTLDHLGKFEGKADEGFLVGYSVNSKAFRVFNTRTKNVAGSGPKWLFDIDSLTKSINYELVTAGNHTNDDAGIETNVNTVQTGQD